MKSIVLFLTFCLNLYTESQAQLPPNAFNYSAIARDNLGQPLITTVIGIQISILKTSPLGVSQFSENHTVITDNYGLFNLVVGAGAIQSGSISTIDWGNDNYFLKIGIDVNGGTNFLEVGTTQLLSVPYALYAKKAGSIIAGGNSSDSLQHHIGESYGGGIIFHLWKDAFGVEHGLIVDKIDLSLSHSWSNVEDTIVGIEAQSYWNGKGNSQAIVAQTGHTTSAASLCLNSTNGGFNDWYLPSLDELELISKKIFDVNIGLRSINDATEIKNYIDPTQNVYYLSSTEAFINKIYCYDLYTHAMNFYNKYDLGLVRAIRSF